MFEERITVWLADSFDHAIAQAEEEAREYADAIEAEYLDFAQAFHLATAELSSGTEVFSLIRESKLSPDEYLTTFFDTGTERQHT